MSLKKAIRDVMPFEMELALKKRKKLNQFVDFVYLCLPEYMKGKDGHRDGLMRVNYMFKHYNFTQCFFIEKVCLHYDLNLEEQKKIWNTLNSDLQTIKFNQA